jgi:hypothetical protein
VNSPRASATRTRRRASFNCIRRRRTDPRERTRKKRLATSRDEKPIW